MIDDSILWVIFVLGMIVGGSAIHFGSRAGWEKSAIEAKAGQYNNITGKFEWVSPNKTSLDTAKE